MTGAHRSFAVRHFLISAAAITLIAMGMRAGASVILPLIMIVYITVLTVPLYGWMVRKRLPKGLAAIGVVILLIGIGVGLAWLVFYSFSQLLGHLATIESQFIERLHQLGAVAVADPEIERLFDLTREFLVAVLGQTAGLITTGVVILVGVVLILLDSANLSVTLWNLLERGGDNFAGVRRLPHNLVSYFVARTQINLFTGISIAIFLFIMRIDYAALWALGAFFLSYVPYIGLTVAAIPAVILALVESGPVAAIIVIIGYVVLNQVAEVILEPKITGARLSLKPWFVFLAMFVFAWLMGPAGVLLAGPMTVFVVILFSMFDDTQWILDLIMTKS